MTRQAIVVGAGPAGLAVAATLRQHGVPYTLLECSSAAGASWLGRYDSLRLHTIRWLSGLPGAPIPRQYGPWVARDDLVRYLHDYAERFDIRPELRVELTRLDRQDGVWSVETTNGTREAPAVVVATGYSRKPHIPSWPGRSTFTRPLMHSADYRDPSPFQGHKVLVVGAGNSAAEIAVELAAAEADVFLSVRTPPNIVRRDTAGVPSQLLGIALKRAPERLMNPLAKVLRRVSVPDLTEYGLSTPDGDGFTQFLRTQTVPILDHGFVRAVREGSIKVVPAVDDVDADGARLADGSRLDPDAIICATGYRPGLEPMIGHLDVLNERGTPRVHGARTLPHTPGLYFVGITVELAGLLREIGLEARAIGRAIAGR